VLERLALKAELPADVVETGHRGAIVTFGGFAVDHDASGGESRP
jgi:hypothetical protein